mmetsp:Transcript_10270/g.26975  ORF Transcript_10270/g.26975 Transcript_10270/m.26975 type:complete len:217 (-) Transcript_10270:549-1199(-)
MGIGGIERAIVAPTFVVARIHRTDIKQHPAAHLLDAWIGGEKPRLQVLPILLELCIVWFVVRPCRHGDRLLRSLLRLHLRQFLSRLHGEVVVQLSIGGLYCPHLLPIDRCHCGIVTAIKQRLNKRHGRSCDPGRRSRAPSPSRVQSRRSAVRVWRPGMVQSASGPSSTRSFLGRRGTRRTSQGPPWTMSTPSALVAVVWHWWQSSPSSSSSCTVDD